MVYHENINKDNNHNINFCPPSILSWSYLVDAYSRIGANIRQLPFFILLSVIEALAFGLGISFILLGWPRVQKFTSPSKNKAIAMYYSISWLLISWWPHDNLHIHNGMNPVGLLLIDYGFHVTLIFASLIVAYGFLAMLRDKR